MANKKVVNQFKLMYKQIQEITPNIYSAIAIAMHRHGYSFDEIEDLFADSQEIWSECWDAGIDMAEMCKRETGIDVVKR